MSMVGHYNIFYFWMIKNYNYTCQKKNYNYKKIKIQDVITSAKQEKSTKTVVATKVDNNIHKFSIYFGFLWSFSMFETLESPPQHSFQQIKILNLRSYQRDWILESKLSLHSRQLTHFFMIFSFLGGKDVDLNIKYCHSLFRVRTDT
jgi:hypothetical protein